MNSKKKNLIIILWVTLITTLFTGCEKGDLSSLKSWTIFPAVDAEQISPEHMAKVPSALPGTDGNEIAPQKVKARLLKDQKNQFILNFETITGSFEPRRAVVCYAEITTEKAMKMKIGAAADWWMDIYVNGEQAYSTMEDGNGTHDYIPNDHPFEIKLKVGQNLISAKVLSGSKGWTFIIGELSKK